MSYEQAKELFLQGKSIRSISEQLGYDRKKLSQQLKADGLNIKARGITKGTQKYNHNTNTFKVIDNEEKAYWLGFLYADGSIYRPRGTVELGLADKDRTHLEKFRDFISPELPVKTRKVKLNNEIYLASRIQLVNMEITNDLIDKGCVEAKSLVLNFPSYDIVPQHLIHHFMRGYFDGDGSCFVRSDGQIHFSILGTEQFLLDYYKHLKDTGLNLNKMGYDGNARNLHWSGNKIYKLFKDYLYRDATIYLARKLPVPI